MLTTQRFSKQLYLADPELCLEGTLQAGVCAARQGPFRVIQGIGLQSSEIIFRLCNQHHSCPLKLNKPAKSSYGHNCFDCAHNEAKFITLWTAMSYTITACFQAILWNGGKVYQWQQVQKVLFVQCSNGSIGVAASIKAAVTV